ncbi:unnamed protein product [Nippostrongylus brasiliensis]|uniref:Uncharacterized protein n=1 Tax=Nippostrongylus brasiliensis TaxID=27835 RepID=A0A0N4Y841_NIPBR|nr:unnamed protein product [Nippostrongylus brasiliensis]
MVFVVKCQLQSAQLAFRWKFVRVVSYDGSQSKIEHRTILLQNYRLPLPKVPLLTSPLNFLIIIVDLEREHFTRKNYPEFLSDTEDADVFLLLLFEIKVVEKRKEKNEEKEENKNDALL